MSNFGPRTFPLSSSDMYQCLVDNNYQPMPLKEIAARLGIDITNRQNQKGVSNRCMYLVTAGWAERVDHGVYRALKTRATPAQKGTNMTTLDMPTSAPQPPNPIPTAVEADGPVCNECGYVAKSAMGLKAHITRQHTAKLSADEAFERIGKACEILFPDGIDMSRIIEIAELQKQILRVITR